MWLFFAFASAFFAGITAILAKCGIRKTDSSVATAIRTSVVLIMAWLTVFVSGKQHTLREIPGTEFAFICLSGIATGASWLCYYKALKDGPASIVVPIDKLSLLVSILFACLVLKEKLTRKSVIGLCLITAGTLALLIDL